MLKTQKPAATLEVFQPTWWFGEEKGQVWLRWGQGRDLQVGSGSGAKPPWRKSQFSPFWGSIWRDRAGRSAVGVGRGVAVSQEALHRTTMGDAPPV